MTQAVRESEPRTYRAAPSKNIGEDADPVTTEVVRHSLQVAANYMKRALVRTSFSPTIYEVLDFAAAIYDREVRLLAQAPTLPLFMGTMNFCVEAAVEAVGGEDALEPGDIILYNDPFGTGSHQQDAALIMPVFYRDDTLIGYTGIKAHLQDIGGKEPYSTDTVDVFQEGTIFPGLKLYKRGELSDEVHRMLVANSRVPKYVVGDVEALVVAVRAGAAALCDVVDRFGLDEVETCVERMYDHGEAVIRSYFEKIPDGRYVAHGMMDNNGVDTDSIPFEVALEVEGSTVRVDYSSSPPMQNGPVNCPIASTVSATRMAIMWIAGGGDNVNEGYFRPVEIVSRPGTMFDPVWPAPSFLYFIPAMQAMEVILRAMSEVMPEAVPAASDCDIQATVWWGVDEETGEPWAEGMPHMGGQGAWSRSDGQSCLMHPMEAATRNIPCEVYESRDPWLITRFEMAPDTCGPPASTGADWGSTWTTPCWPTPSSRSSSSATSPRPGALRAVARAAAPTSPTCAAPTESARRSPRRPGSGWPLARRSRCAPPAGGGYGPAALRAPEAVLADLREGLISEDHARAFYPHVFEASVAAE